MSHDTPLSQFVDFGPGTPFTLHGNEAIVYPTAYVKGSPVECARIGIGGRMSEEDVRTLYNRISTGGHLPRRIEWMGTVYVNDDPVPEPEWEVDEDYEGGHPARPADDDAPE